MKNGELRQVGKATIVCMVHRLYRSRRDGLAKWRWAAQSTTYDVIVDDKSVKGETILRSYKEAHALAMRYR